MPIHSDGRVRTLVILHIGEMDFQCSILTASYRLSSCFASAGDRWRPALALRVTSRSSPHYEARSVFINLKMLMANVATLTTQILRVKTGRSPIATPHGFLGLAVRATQPASGSPKRLLLHQPSLEAGVVANLFRGSIYH